MYASCVSMIKFAHIWFKHSLHVRAVDNYDEGVKDEFEILRHTVLLLLLLLSMFIGKTKQITLLFLNCCVSRCLSNAYLSHPTLNFYATKIL